MILRRLLLLVILVELLGGGYFLYRKRSEPVPPVPDLSAVDPLVAAHIRDRAAHCRTADDWAALGETYLAYGYFPEGEACYRAAVSRTPNDHQRRADWAFSLERIGRPDRALVEYVRAATPDPQQQGECLYAMGRNGLRNGDSTAATRAFQEATTQPSARYELARLKAKAGEPKAAIRILDQLATEFPNAVQPPLLRHRIEVLRDSPTAAVYADRADRFFHTRLPTPFDRDWKRLDERYQSVGLHREWREADDLLQAGQPADAEKRARDALAFGWNPDGVDLLAEIESRKGQPAEAARLLQEIIDRAGPSAAVLDAIGDAYVGMGKPDLAVQAWVRAAELGIGASAKMPYHKLTTHYEKAGDQTAARRFQARAFLAAGHEEFWAGRLQDAQFLMQQATDTDARLGAAWFYLGEVHRLSNRPDDACTAYRKCLDLDPDFGRAHTGLMLLDLRP
jgi:tetratricopeptide (TPR) repeat protein